MDRHALPMQLRDGPRYASVSTLPRHIQQTGTGLFVQYPLPVGENHPSSSDSSRPSNLVSTIPNIASHLPAQYLDIKKLLPPRRWACHGRFCSTRYCGRSTISLNVKVDPTTLTNGYVERLALITEFKDPGTGSCNRFRTGEEST